MSRLGRGRTTVLLTGMVMVLAAALLVEVRYLGADGPAPSVDRPVVTGEATQLSAVRAAASAAGTALSYGHEDFDSQVEDATALMTPEFAAEYRRATAGDRSRFVRERSTQEVRVVGSAVVSATDVEAAALLFLDQYLARAGAGTSVTQYRALVTVVRRDGRWLLSDIRAG
jgi:Mce-associated membrane protein